MHLFSMLAPLQSHTRPTAVIRFNVQTRDKRKPETTEPVSCPNGQLIVRQNFVANTRREVHL